jgi:hypothetical protein
MNLGEIIQNFAALSALFLGIVYIIGGLIVNLNLTRRGVVEYQILKVKFLAVGIIFIIQFLGVVVFTLIPVVIIGTFNPAAEVIQMISIPSILAALGLLYIWSRYPSNTTSVYGRWPFWFAMSVIATVYPLYTLLHQALIPLYGYEWIFLTVLAVLVAVLTILAEIYHYSSFYYGRPASLGAIDPIGMGIPTRIDLVCDESVSADLIELGLPMEKHIIRNIYLIDETNDHYLVSQEQVPGGDGNNLTFKINKTLVKAILHKPDHMRKMVEKKKKGKPGDGHPPGAEKQDEMNSR